MGFASRLGRILTCLFLLPAVAPGLDLKTHARWEYAIGGAEQRPDDVDSLRFATLPRFDRLERLVQGGIGYLWIRAVYQRPAELLGKEAAILTGAAIVADETFLDGEKIGSGGRFPPAFFNDWNDVRVWRLPPAAFPKTDTLLIRLYVHHQGAIGSVVADARLGLDPFSHGQLELELGLEGELEGRDVPLLFDGIDRHCVTRSGDALAERHTDACAGNTRSYTA